MKRLRDLPPNRDRVWPWLAFGSVCVRLDKVAPLADAAAGHPYLESSNR
jgi:hypothetical protein